MNFQLKTTITKKKFTEGPVVQEKNHILRTNYQILNFYMWILLGIIWLAVPAISAAKQDKDKDVVLHLDFDTRKGKQYQDLSGNGNHGAPRHTTPIPGVKGRGVLMGTGLSGGQCVAVKPPVALQQPIPALTMEAWIALDRLWCKSGIIGTGEWNKGKEPFGLWLCMGKVDLHITQKDGTRLELRTPKTVIRKMTRPGRTYYHVVGTYDGQTARLYVDGKQICERRAKTSQPIAPLRKDILVGKLYGRDWEKLHGAMDEVRILNRALTPEEVKERYESRCGWKPAPMIKKAAGTLDGGSYVGTNRFNSFIQCYLPCGTVANFSNVGDFNLSIRDWSDTWGFVLLDQRSRKERFWKNVDGHFECDVDSGAFTYELEGMTHHGLKLREVVSADKEGLLSIRYEARSPDGKGPVPYMPMRYNLPNAASKRFVGDSAEGLVWGYMPDLDRSVNFRRAVDWSFANLRVGMRLGDGVEYRMDGSRDPRRWKGGYSGFLGNIHRADFKAWPKDGKGKWTLDLQVQVRNATAKPWLTSESATRITEDKRFDFSGLYVPDSNHIAIVPADRRAHVYGMDESVSLQVRFPDGMKPKILSYSVVVSKTGRVVLKDEIKLSPEWWNLQPPVLFTPKERGVYLVKVRALDKDRTELGTAVQEVAVVGPIPQPVLAPGKQPVMNLVDRADLTKDGDHDYFSYSGKAKVVEIGGKRYRQTLTFDKMKSLGLRHDWIGCRLRVKHPMRPHIIVIEHPNLDGMNMAINVLEPKNEGPNVSKFIPLNRGLSGVWTGAGYPSDNGPRTTSIVYFPSASWVAVTMQNIHSRFMPDKPGAAVAKVSLYELRDELPRTLKKEPTHRLVGVFTEGGTLGLGAFGNGTIRGIRPKLPPKKTFYRGCFTAVENLVKYLRYRGDSVYIYGAVRYRSAEFPGITVPPIDGMERGDLVALMAKIFEYNGLKLLLGIEANPLINVQRLPGYGTSLCDIAAGAGHIRQIGPDGNIPTSAWGPTANPFHPAVQAEYAHLAAEIGKLYKDYPAVAGIAWMTGNRTITCPSLVHNNRWLKGKDKKWPLQYSTTYDDETMRRFAAFLGRKLPGKPGDPKRFRERFEWIMNNALDKWTEFRCRAHADMYRDFKNALRKQAPGMEMFVMDDNMGVVTDPPLKNASALELLRVFSFDPRKYRNEPGLNYAILMPDSWEWFDRGRMKKNLKHWREDCSRWENSDELWDTLDPVNGGVFLHRQFEEKQVFTPPDRDWVFPRRTQLAYCNYPQPAGRQNLRQFAHILSRSTPKLICWMWCDDGIPLGHEESMREFAAAYRQIPAGEYKTIYKENGCVVRRQKQAGRMAAFYAVNTGNEPVRIAAPGPAEARYQDAVTGAALNFSAKGKAMVKLAPYAVKVFVSGAKNP